MRHDERARIAGENSKRLADSKQSHAAPTPPASNTDDIRHAVREMVAQIHDQHSKPMQEQMGQFTQ